MAPIKFEKELKEKLEQRKLQPSVKSWEQLEARLNVNEDKGRNKGFWWLGIAASFVGILIIASMFFNNNENSIEPIIVDVEEQSTPEAIKDNIESITNEVKVVEVESQDEKLGVEELKQETVNTSEAKVQIQKRQEELVSKTHKEAIAQVEVEKSNNTNVTAIKTTDILSFEDKKLNEVVAQVQKLQQENNVVTDAEINKLLDEAQKEITLHKLYNESTKKVDAMALLQGVEDDLQKSFRNRAFEAIKSGYDYVKTAVADRNN